MWFLYGLFIFVAALLGFEWERMGGMIVACGLCVLAIQNIRLHRKVDALGRRLNERGQNDRVYDPSPSELRPPESVCVSPVERRPEPTMEPPPIPEVLTKEPPPLIDETEAMADDFYTRAEAMARTRLRDFFTRGNVMVKLAWIILFFGVGFLLKYASDRQMFPVELRYLAASSLALVLLVLGWRMRIKHRSYALLLQGGAIGLLYMTVFAASKLHGLLPMGLTFFVLVALVLFSGLLAVLQDARMTAAVGAVGGFLAPVLTSTGSGSHVMLFTYYAILNSGILGIAWFKAWRELNLIGFFFTFGIGGLWGVSAYRAEYFWSTEPFLILFFVYFAMLSVLFALKQPPRLKGYVDGSLVFGLPVIAFTLQGFLVHDMDGGLALSALSLSLFYLVLARTLWNRNIEGMRTLTEAFLALGMVFGSLALPLSVDGRFTAAAWAMEGAALVWVGIRQKRVIARLAGVLLQAGAGLSFLEAIDGPVGTLPLINGFYLGCLAVGLSGLFSAYYLQRHRAALYRWEWGFHTPVMVWGLLWWYGSGLGEIVRRVEADYQLAAVAGLFALSAWLLSALYDRLSWPALRYPLFLLVFVLAGLLGFEIIHPDVTHPFEYGGYLAWPLSLAVFYRILFCHEKDLDLGWRRVQHRGGLLLFIALLTSEIAFVMQGLSRPASVWVTMCWGLVPACCALMVLARTEKPAWPFGQDAEDYQTMALVPVMAFLALWFVKHGLLNDGNPAPLPYVPIVNPLELIQLFVLLVFSGWIIVMTRNLPWFFKSLWAVKAWIVTAVLCFFWMNTVLGRSVHVFGGIPYHWDRLWHSMTFQAGASVLWSSLALVITVWSARRGLRVLWFVGAFLLSCVVFKLFFVDLSRSGTIARIVSFLSTGALMLIIGFFSPLPPASKENKQ